MLTPSHLTRQRIAIALIIAVGAGVLVLVSPYLSGLLLGLVLHVIVEPVYRRLTRRMPASAASALVIIGVIVLVVTPTALIVSMLVAQLPGALRSVQETGLISSLDSLAIGPVDLGARLGELGATAAGWVAGRATAVLGGAASTILDLIIALFALYYLLRSGDRVWVSVRPFIPFSEGHADELLEQFRSATRGTLVGSLLIAFVQGGLVGLAFFAAGMAQAPLWGVVAVVASVIPVVGSTIVYVPGAIALAMQGRTGAAVGLALFCGLVVSSVDNFLRPMVNERISAVHPMVTLIGAFAGLGVFGLLGLILGPLAISYFFVLLRMYKEEYAPLVPLEGGPVNTPPASGR